MTDDGKSHRFTDEAKKQDVELLIDLFYFDAFVFLIRAEVVTNLEPRY